MSPNDQSDSLMDIYNHVWGYSKRKRSGLTDYIWFIATPISVMVYLRQGDTQRELYYHRYGQIQMGRTVHAPPTSLSLGNNLSSQSW